jgi:hypothetical protein
MMKEVKLPSGAVLKIGLAPFEAARSLYQAVLEEAKSVMISSSTEMASVYKDLFCLGFSSKKIENCLWECLKNCLYNDLRIDAKTFEPVTARNDYMTVCMEVAKENIHPFVKSLYAEYGQFLSTLLSDRG